MKLPAENYKGIEFVRISNLPEDQRQKFDLSFARHRIIKILKGTELLTDCIQFADYTEWYSKNHRAETATPKRSLPRTLLLPSFKGQKVFKK
jgi:hypothetical protein